MFLACVYSYDREDCSALSDGWNPQAYPFDISIVNIGHSTVTINVELSVLDASHDVYITLSPTQSFLVDENLWP